jgi:hypothetical protein
MRLRARKSQLDRVKSFGGGGVVRLSGSESDFAA